mmetsp:Transcript_26706/g.44533  ORF Transcript_26706/g.44533 Transcript_26706/m.44533 type:complete len:213 (+) Transcript_26706:364-1002(+)
MCWIAAPSVVWQYNRMVSPAADREKDPCTDSHALLSSGYVRIVPAVTLAPKVRFTVPSLVRNPLPVQALSVMYSVTPAVMLVKTTMATKSGLSELTCTTMTEPTPRPLSLQVDDDDGGGSVVPVLGGVGAVQVYGCSGCGSPNKTGTRLGKSTNGLRFPCHREQALSFRTTSLVVGGYVSCHCRSCDKYAISKGLLSEGQSFKEKSGYRNSI